MSALEDIIENEIEEAYNKGLNDAWELAKKIVLPDKDGGMKISEIKNVFKINHVDVNDILRNFTPQEALAKLEAYEKEQAEIKVGDVVEVNGCKFLVTTVANDHINLIDSKGITTWTTSTCKKTGKHIDIQPILEQIRE